MRIAELKKNSSVLLKKCRIADTFFSRLMGLMGKKQIPQDEAIVFPRCNSIHTFFMRFPIDVIFVSAEGKVVALSEAVGPWRLILPKARVKHTIEMRAARAKELGISVGDTLGCEGVFS